MRDKLIEEMAKSICDIQCNGMKCNECDTGCEYRMQAIALYNAGYRKASDVVREIFRDIYRMLNYYKPYRGLNNIVYNVFGILEEVEKKYTESEGEG